jgi:DNA-binding LacI/PurR family transcriptional regulator
VPDDVDQEARHRRPTIRDVAELAGVSKSLVSLVLRSSPKVSDKSRAAVEEAIEELGYRPSAMARSLVNRHSGIGGMITSDAHDIFHADVIAGVSSYVTEQEDSLVPLILHGDNNADQEALAAQRFMELRAEWLILMGSSLPVAAIERLGRETPTAIVGRLVELNSVDVIANDDRAGAALATKHLLDLGHRRIAHITGGDGGGAAERAAAYRRVMEDAGCEPILVEGTYLQAGGARAAGQILERPGPLPTAIFAANDLAAVGAMSVLRTAGHRVPDDVSVVGYDDIGLAGIPQIDLTTINQPAGDLGRTAARLLYERRKNGRLEGRRVLLDPKLVVRSSTRAI